MNDLDSLLSALENGVATGAFSKFSFRQNGVEQASVEITQSGVELASQAFSIHFQVLSLKHFKCLTSLPVLKLSEIF